MTQETNKAAVTDQNFVETVKDYVIEKVTGQGWKQDFKTDKSNPRRLTSVKVASNDIEVLQSLHAAAVGIFAAQVGEIVKGQINMKTLKPFKMEENLISMAVNFSGPRISVWNPLNPSGSYNAGGTTSKSIVKYCVVFI